MHESRLAALPPSSRVWVFASSRDLSVDDEARIHTLMEKVFGVWRSKSAMAHGCHEIRERRFLVVGADETGERISGCGIDAMMSWLMRLESESGLTLVDRMSVFWRDRDGRVRRSSRPEFKSMMSSGEVDETTRVFDTTVSSAAALNGGRFELPLTESWHAALFTIERAGRD